jgi:alpha-galactosidase
MSVIAAVNGDVQLLKQAMLHDPLTAAVCNPPEVWQMTDEMIVAQAEWLPQYAHYLETAKRNLATAYIKPGALSPNPNTKVQMRDTETIVKARREARAEKAAKDYNPDKRV